MSRLNQDRFNRELLIALHLELYKCSWGYTNGGKSMILESCTRHCLQWL